MPLAKIHIVEGGYDEARIAKVVLLFARGLVATLLRCGQAIEARRVQEHLLELDDHLLNDVGLTRADVRFGNIATFIRQSHRPASH